MSDTEVPELRDDDRNESRADMDDKNMKRFEMDALLVTDKNQIVIEEAKKRVKPSAAAGLSDPIQRAMGEMGRWHIFVCGIIFLMKFPVGWHQMSIIFLAPPVTYTCNSTNPNASLCSDECQDKIYDRSIFTETIRTEWDLVCDKAALANISQTVVMLGILIGNVLFGALADSYGRRWPLNIAVVIQLVASVATAFVSHFWLFCVLRFITAFATGGTMVTSFVLMMEIIGVKHREICSVLYQLPFYLGHLSLPAFSYILRDWRYFQFAISIPSVVLLSYFCFIPESPRWLFAMNRIDESVLVLEKAAKHNKLPRAHIQGHIEEFRELRTAAQTGPTKKGNLFDLLKTPNLRMKTICMCFNWFVCGLAFFGVAQYIGQAGGDIFTNVAISAIVELPGTFICIYGMKKYGRRKTLMFANLVTGFAMLAIAFVDASHSLAIVILAAFGMVGMSISFPTIYLYGGELFPTVVRNVGVGAASMTARIGSMIAPFVAGLASVNHFLPPLIFSFVPFIGTVLAWYLPETKGQPLPETIEDGENFGKKEPKIRPKV